MDLDLWKDNIIDIICDIADKKKQEESWPVGKDDIPSIIEMYELLEDFRIEEFLASKDNNLTDQQVKLGKQLVEAMSEYSPPGKELPDEENVLNDPRWNKVRFAATEFLESLKREGLHA
jgi:hypothetical protein